MRKSSGRKWTHCRRMALFWKKYWQLCVMLAIPLLFLIVFYYGPMYGLLIAFKDYKPGTGILKSPWAGMKYFKKFIQSYQFSRVMKNTLSISLYTLIAGFPLPIMLALSLNACTSLRFKKFVQTVTYAPYFISAIVMVGMLMQMLSPKYGIVNNIIRTFGGREILFMNHGRMFNSIYVWSGIWQTTGWGAIIYISALSGVDPELHEAAIMDGASRMQRILHIDIPGILPTIITMLIMNTGSLLNVGYEKIYLMQNSANMEYSEVISTYIYKIGLAASMPNYSYSTAIGLFNGVINFSILVAVNKLAKRFTANSLW